MNDQSKGVVAAEPQLESMVSLDGDLATIQAGAGILNIEFHSLDFNEGQNPPNPNWVSRAKTITPPAGWTRVFVSVAQWDFNFFPRERPISYLGVRAGVRLTGATLEITANAICRDANADDPWKGRVTIQVIFLG